MPSPIVENMIARTAIPVVDADTVTDFIKQSPRAVLFFCADPKKYPESNDVAMALPEIIKEYDGLAGALVAQSCEIALQKEFNFTAWPALAFFKEGQYLGAITGIQNWDDYLEKINQMFAKDLSATIATVNL
ncbi:hypothetical protein GCM10025791_46750 [Halioxenophilus aromaticivorans]|uniref:Hydrogenase expression/formation protein n=2 Tax=Halioxenophilus aromaticivorans TaxID=1306992 RepID=A0AAV3U9N1_9ALTE